MARHSPLQQIKEAKQIAKDHGLVLIEKAGTYVLYRKTPDGNVRLGARATPSGIRSYTARCANFR